MKLNTFNLGLLRLWQANYPVLIMNSALRRISEADKRRFIMRANLVIFILTTCLMQVSAAGFAQRLTFSKKNTNLEQVFQELEKQTGYKVLYSDQKVNDTKKLDVNFSNASIAEVMEDCLRSQPLTYKIDHKTIVIKEKSVNIFDRLTAYLSSINVEGKAVDAESGKPIYNVNINLKGSRRSVASDENGRFVFNSLPDDAILIVSSVGYVTQELKASSIMFVKMLPANQTLNDVTVSTGYQTLKKSSTTGAFSLITAKDIESTPSINLLERLEGKIPGVQFDIRNNKIQIRGVSSYNSNYTPLIVIDGFASSNQNLTTVATGLVEASLTFKNQPATSGNAIIGTFNPADIESITFLKDAAASAIWGAKAANGVIVITTKHGRKGVSDINFSATLSTSAPGNFSNLTSMNSAQYIELEQELVNNNFISDPVVNGYRSAPVSEAEQWMLKAKMNPIYTAQRDSALSVLAKRSNIDQLKQYLLQRAVSQQYNLSFSGGADNSSYYVSGNYTKDQPVFKSNFGERYSVLTNLTNDFLNKKLSLATGISYTYSKSQVNSAALQALGNGQFGLTPYDLLVDQNGNKIYRGVMFTTRVSDSLTRVRGLLPWTYNAIDELNYGNTINTNSAFRFNATLTGKITDWLKVSAAGQMQKSFEEQVLLQNQNSFYTRNLINTGTNPSNTATLGTPYGFPKGGIYNNGRIYRDSYGLRAQFNIDKNFGTDHHFDMVGGTEISQQKARSNSQILYGYNEDLSTFANVNTTQSGRYNTIFGTATLPSPVTTIYRNTVRNLSYFTTGTYAYLGKYYVSGSIRFDDINVLGASREARATPLWSTGLRWDIMKENFMNKVNWINALSLRGSYGSAGNPPGTANVSTVNVGQVDSYTQLPYTTVGAAANPGLNWEITKMLNGGIDASFLQGRLNTNIDVYRKRTTNILMSLPINAAYGLTSLNYNAGSLSGHGLEVNVTGEIVKSKDWGWSSNFNISYNTNNVTDSRFPAKVVTVGANSAITTGYPLDNMFVYRWAGLDNTGKSQIYAADGSIISSTNNNVKPEDRVYAGRTTAPYFGGFSNTVRYKNLSLSARATYYLGHKFLYQSINSSLYPTSGGYSGLIATSRDLVNRWRKPGDEAFTNVPGLVGVNLNTVDRYVNSDINVRDAGNIRLQQISLSYSVPKSMLRKTPFIKAINLGATVSNLGLIWVANKEGIDPSYQMTNSFNNLPPTRNYVFNLNLSL
jgi:TonB-linked SusC/RagA family outer membrane protein